MKQEQAWKKLQDKTTRFPVFGGGAGGGKSWLGCEWLLTNCYFYPNSKWFIGREELKRLMSSTYITWNKVCKHHKIPSTDWTLDGKYNVIKFFNGSSIDLLDVAYQPSDPLYERFGSLEYTGGWIDEAGETDFNAFDILKTRCGRHLNKEYGLLPKIFLTCNPNKGWLYRTVYKPFREGTLPKEYAFIQSLYQDNEHTAKEYGEQLDQITDRITRQRLKLGIWEYDDDANSMMNYNAITDLFTNTIVQNNTKYLTADIARLGKDKTVVRLWKGLENYKTIEWGKTTLDVTEIKIKDLLVEEKIPYSQAIVDEDGVGGGVVDHLSGIKGFVNNSTPIETISGVKPNFQNLKTQCYYLLADKVNNHEIVIKNATEEQKTKTIEELEQVKTKDSDKDGKLKIESKDQTKEILGRSPDYADSLMMRMWFELKPQSTPIIYKQPIFQSITDIGS